MRLKDLKDKLIVVVGDSVSAEATIGCPKTYSNLFQNKYHTKLRNYAIGGTTATYMFKGSNIEKEYTLPDKLFAVDGCRIVKEAVEKGEFNDASLVFIEYAHNDMFFQTPIDNERVNDDILSLDNCMSFKASYRYMVNKIRSVNKDAKIVLVGCTYSEYDIASDLIYGSKYKYSDYRTAIKEVAEELNCIYVETWDYMRKYFFCKCRKYYKDYVHPNALGQKKLFKLLDKQMKRI